MKGLAARKQGHPVTDSGSPPGVEPGRDGKSRPQSNQIDHYTEKEESYLFCQPGAPGARLKLSLNMLKTGRFLMKLGKIRFSQRAGPAGRAPAARAAQSVRDQVRSNGTAKGLLILADPVRWFLDSFLETENAGFRSSKVSAKKIRF